MGLLVKKKMPEKWKKTQLRGRTPAHGAYSEETCPKNEKRNCVEENRPIGIIVKNKLPKIKKNATPRNNKSIKPINT